MCLAVIALHAHPRYALVLAANRDEFHARAAAPAAWGDDDAFRDILAGRDLAAGGTWLGVHRNGRFAFVTNVRAGHGTRSRGPLARRAGAAGAQFAQTRFAMHSPPSRTKATPTTASTCSPRMRPARCGCRTASRAFARWRPGIHGLSNAALDTPWPKVERTKAALAQWVARGSEDLDVLFAALADRTGAPDADLPATGVTLERERALAAPFIVGDDYGTRCSTVLHHRPRRRRPLRGAFVRTGGRAHGRARGVVPRGLGVARSRRGAAQASSRSRRTIVRCGMPASRYSSPSGTKPNLA